MLCALVRQVRPGIRCSDTGSATGPVDRSAGWSGNNHTDFVGRDNNVVRIVSARRVPNDQVVGATHFNAEIIVDNNVFFDVIILIRHVDPGTVSAQAIVRTGIVRGQ